MKKFPGIVKVFAAIGLAILSILIIQACAHHVVSDGHGKKFELAFSRPLQVKDPANFCNILEKDLSSSAIYNFEVVQDDGNGKSERCCKPSDCSVTNRTVKVDKITTSRIAEASANELTPIGSHVTQRIYSDVNADIALVLGQAKTESH
jgi:hypothetical protein